MFVCLSVRSFIHTFHAVLFFQILFVFSVVFNLFPLPLLVFTVCIVCALCLFGTVCMFVLHRPCCCIHKNIFSEINKVYLIKSNLSPCLDLNLRSSWKTYWPNSTIKNAFSKELSASHIFNYTVLWRVHNLQGFRDVCICCIFFWMWIFMTIWASCTVCCICDLIFICC